MIKAMKDVWDEYSNLIKTLTAIFIFVSAGIGSISGVIIKGMMNDIVLEKTGQVKAVTDLTTAVSTLNATVIANTVSVERLDETTKILQADVTAIHKHLAGID